MEKIKVDYDELVIRAILALNQYKNRRSITNHELKILTTRLCEKASLNNISVFIDEYNFDQDDFFTYVDGICDDHQIIYRLKPSCNLSKLKKEFTLVPAILESLFDTEELVKDLNDFDEIAEKSFLPFQQIDEKYQLKMMFELFKLEMKKRKLMQELYQNRKHVTSLVDEVQVEEFLEQNPKIDYVDYVEHFSSDGLKH